MAKLEKWNSLATHLVWEAKQNEQVSSEYETGFVRGREVNKLLSSPLHLLLFVH